MSGSTYQPIELIAAKLEGISDVPAYADALVAGVLKVKTERDAFYDSQTASRNKVLKVRAWMIWLAVSALLATALAAGLRLSGLVANWRFLGMDADSVPLFVALASYAAMSAFSFWETATASTAGYFRHVELRLANRDLWTAFEFEVSDVLEEHARGSLPVFDAKDRMRAAAQTVVTRMDALARSELSDWKGEFQTSVTQLGTVGRDGLAAVKGELQAVVDARLAKIEKVAVEAKVAADAAAEAAKPKPLSYAMVAIDGAFVGELEITLDDQKPVKTTSSNFPLPPIPSGVHCLRIAAKDQDGKALEAAKYADLKAGVSEVKMTLA